MTPGKIPTGRLSKLAQDNLMPFDFVKQAYEIFIEVAMPSPSAKRGEEYDILT